MTKIDNGGIGDPTAYGLVTSALVTAGDGATVLPTGLPYAGHGLIVALPEYGAVLTGSDGPTVAEWVRTVAGAVTGPRLRQRAFGAWQSDGVTYLDVVEIFPSDDRDAAVAAGRARNQIAIWDAGRGEEIATDGDGTLPVEVFDQVSGQTTLQRRDPGF